MISVIRYKICVLFFFVLSDVYDCVADEDALVSLILEHVVCWQFQQHA